MTVSLVELELENFHFCLCLAWEQQSVKSAPPWISTHCFVRKEFYVGAWKGVTEELYCSQQSKAVGDLLESWLCRKGSDWATYQLWIICSPAFRVIWRIRLQTFHSTNTLITSCKTCKATLHGTAWTLASLTYFQTQIHFKDCCEKKSWNHTQSIQKQM